MGAVLAGAGLVPAQVSLAEGPPRTVSAPAGQGGQAQGVGSVSGVVFLDHDGNGRLDAGETPLAGVPVKATKDGADGQFGTKDDVGRRAVLTGPTGRYEVALLSAGRYRVEVDRAALPAGVVATTAHPTTVVLARGEARSAVDFGWRPPGGGVVGDLVWLDDDGNGAVDAGEAPLPSVGVRLTRPGPDGAPGTADDEPVATTASDATGHYRFDNLGAGSYRVAVDLGTAPVGARATTPIPVDVAVGTGTSHLGVDFGFQRSGEIGDFVWLDRDADGAVDPGDSGLAGVAVDLTGLGADGRYGTADDRPAGRAVTDADGLYRFSTLVPGAYQADLDTATLPPGSAPLGAASRATTVASGQLDLDVDFAVRWTGSVGGRAWLDADGDGVGGAGETGLAGVAVVLTSAGADGLLDTADDLELGGAATSASGDVRFDNLAPGAYRLTSDAATAPAGTAPSTAGSATVAVVAGAPAAGAAFGFRWAGSIGDLVFLDRDADGVADAGEPGFAAADVRLLSPGADGQPGSADDQVVARVVTDAQGGYSFPGLAPGTYSVAVDQWSVGFQYRSTTPSGPVVLAPGEQRSDLDVGFAAPEWLSLRLDTGAVSTAAGSGVASNVDGTGTAASFSSLTAVVVVGGSVYVAAGSAIRRVDPVTGQVTTLAGSSTTTGCVDSATASSARFAGVAALATDGRYLFAADRNCGLVRRVSLATGATNTLTPRGVSGVTFAGDWLYASTSGGGVLRIDPLSGATTQFAAENGNAITSDASALWITQNSSCIVPCLQRIRRLPLDGSPATTLAQDTLAGEVLVSAGDHLYAVPYGSNAQHGVVRYAKSTGARQVVAGVTAAGYVDGTGTDAWFSSVASLATDGQSLWVADNGNRRLRRIDAGTALPSAQQASATRTLAFATGAVTTAAGSGASANVDGTGTSASFSALAGTVVVGGAAFVASGSAIRRVDLATGQVSTLAGSPTAFGCVDSATAASARFSGPDSMTTDGHYLYVADRSCGLVRRVSVATGATSSVLAVSAGGLTFAAGAVYATSSGGGIYRYNLATGVVSRFSTENANTITSDATALWITQNRGCYIPCYQRIQRLPLDGSPATTLAQDTMSGGVLVSAGDHLYAVPYGNSAQNAVVRYDKATGERVVVAGTVTGGYADGTGTGARFNSIGGIASDGESLWVSDHGNRRFRKVSAAPA